MGRSGLSLGRHFLLSDNGGAPGRVRFLSQAIELAEGQKQTWVTVTRTGDFSDPRYGAFSITPVMLAQMVSNFDKRVAGQDIFVDVAHKHSDGAAARVLKLAVEAGKLRALVEWTPFGVDAVQNRGFRYFSAEFHENWTDNEQGAAHGAVLLGAALTIRPVIKHLEPVQLATPDLDDDHAAPARYLISQNLLKQLTDTDMNKYLKLLSVALATLGFTDVTGKPFTDLLTLQLASLNDDDTKCLAAVEGVKSAAMQLADQTKKDRELLLGESLAGFMNRRIEKLATGSKTRQDVIGAMGSAAGIDPGTVNQILNGSIDCPPIERLAGFAKALGVSEDQIRSLAEKDGCKYPKQTSEQDQGEITMNKDDVKKMLSEALSARDTALATASTTLAAKHKLLSDTIAEGDKTLTPEGVKKFAEDYAPMVLAETSDAQVLHLAALAVKQAQALGAATKLAGLGYNPASGSVHISVDSGNSIKALQATIDQRLGFVETDARRFDRTGGTLLAANKAFAEKALEQFDAENGHKLDREHKALAAGTGTISDVAVPVIAERTVLREALYNLNSLNFVNVGTAPFANVITIPYSFRDTTAAGMSALRRYEAQAIRRAGVVQTSEEARPIPQKLAFLISSELQLLMGASVIDFDPISENIRNIVRIVGEDTEAINMNEIVNAADEFSVTTITDTLTAQAQGTNTVFVTTKFPVVRPRKVFDLKGVQQGATVNPIVVTLGGSVKAEYLLPADGSALGVGTYYTMDYNMGELRFVTEAGVSVVPANLTTLTVAYSYSNNRTTFNTDAVGGELIGGLYDRLLIAIGNRKVVVGTDRFYNPNMVLMSNAIDNALSQATSFTANGARNGTGLNADGSVGITKGMSTFNPTAPGLQLADTRIMVGERGNTRFRMVKPFAMNPIEQARDSTGKFTDQRESFGTQFVVSHTPTQIKGSVSSIILFSTAGRVARVA